MFHLKKKYGLIFGLYRIVFQSSDVSGGAPRYINITGAETHRGQSVFKSIIFRTFYHTFVSMT